MSEWTYVDEQVVSPGGSVLFNANPVPCQRGLVWSRSGTGIFELKGAVASAPRCRCQGAPSAIYEVFFGANVAVPTTATVAPITLAISLGGAPIPSSNMIVTPAAVEEFFNISREINALVRCGCCESLTITNLGTTDVVVSNANIIFDKVA